MAVNVINIQTAHPENTDDPSLINIDENINIPIATIIENNDSHIIVINDVENYVNSSDDLPENTKIWAKINMLLIAISIMLPFIMSDFYFACSNKLQIFKLFIYLVVTGCLDIGTFCLFIIAIYNIDLRTLKISDKIIYIVHFYRIAIYMCSFYGLILGIRYWNSTEYKSCVVYITVTSLLKFLGMVSGWLYFTFKS